MCVSCFDGHSDATHGLIGMIVVGKSLFCWKTDCKMRISGNVRDMLINDFISTLEPTCNNKSIPLPAKMLGGFSPTQVEAGWQCSSSKCDSLYDENYPRSV